MLSAGFSWYAQELARKDSLLHALDIEDTTGAMVMMRTYIVKDRLYRMLVTAKPDMRSKTAALRFIDSLRLAETRQ